jgi:FkbM family methyltransferase
MFGLFAAHRWPDAQIAAFEPDPANAAVHERTIALNGMGERWTLVRAAAGASAGQVSFITGGIALSRLAPPGDVPPDRQAAVDAAGAHGSDGERLIEVEQVDVVPQLADVGLVKLDIEGGEWSILQDERFREAPPRAVVLEYHPRFCPSPDARAAATSALQAAGLQVLPVVHRPDGHGTLWAWRA